MSKIFDLSVFEEETLDVKFPTGEIIRIKKPTEKIIIELMKLQDKQLKGDLSAEEQLAVINDVIYMLIQNNADSKEYDKSIIEKLQFNTKIALIQAITDFINEISERKN